MFEFDVDVVMATYNGEPFLEEQLRSLTSQSGPAWRLIVADDGSTDGTCEIIEEFRSRNTERVVLLPPSGASVGPNRTFGRLLEATSAPFVALSDQDDVWMPQRLAETVDALRSAMSASGDVPLLVHSDLEVVDANLRQLHPSLSAFQDLRAGHRTALRHLLVQNSVTGCSVTVNRRLLDLALPIPTEAIMHDWWLALVAAAFGHVLYRPEPLVRYRQHHRNVRGARWRGLPAMGSSIAQMRTSLELTYAQASTLVARYESDLPAASAAEAVAYARIPELDPVLRRIHVLRHGFAKSGPLKAFGMWLLI